MPYRSAYNAGRYSIFTRFPPKPVREDGVTQWYAWDDFASWVGLVDKHGNPSRSKIYYLVQHNCLSATQTKCLPTVCGFDDAGFPRLRFMSRTVVTPRFPEQLEWEPPQWQEAYQALFSRCQSRKGRKSRRKKRQ